jgi:iron complex transport system ATP-binding protein
MVSRCTLTIEALSAGYRHTAVLSGVSLTLSPGIITAIAGINGAGKSTLLKTMAGLIPPLEGNIRIDDKELRSVHLSQLSKRIAVVLTERFGGFNLTVRDAVAAGQMPYTDAFHRLRPVHLNAIEAAMELCGISDYADRLLNELSDGLFQKTMIARGIAQSTDILLLDEPTAYLDYRSKHELFLMLSALAARGKTIIVSTHDLDLILKYCHEVVVITAGSVEKISVADARNNAGFSEIGGSFL